MSYANFPEKTAGYGFRFSSSLFVTPVLCAVAFGGCLLDYDIQDKEIDLPNHDLADSSTDNDTNVTSRDSDDDGAAMDSDTKGIIIETDTDSFVEFDTHNNTATFCEEAEEKSLMVLECGSDGTIDSIDFASFGMYEGSCTGGDAAIGECHFDRTVAVIEAQCLGRSSCQLIADKKEVFDDPCKKDKHRLIAKYTCLYEIGCPSSSLKPVPGKCGCDIPDVDNDGDGSADCNDQCSYDPQTIVAGLCGCGVEETDKDNDGVPKCHDDCDKDPNKTEEGLCGCGKPDIDIGDTDGDGTINCRDKCPSDASKTSPGICGCNRIEVPTDSDGDGIADCVDGCPSDPHKRAALHCGCGKSERSCGYCIDTPGYTDPKGYPCNEWVGDCFLAWLYGYTAAQRNEIEEYCPKSCGLCGFL